MKSARIIASFQNREYITEQIMKSRVPFPANYVIKAVWKFYKPKNMEIENNAAKIVDSWFQKFLNNEKGVYLLKQLGRARQEGGFIVNDEGLYVSERDILYRLEKLKIK